MTATEFIEESVVAWRVWRFWRRRSPSAYHEPSCLWCCLLWVSITAMFVLVASASWVFACDYAPDPASVPPKIEVMAI